MNPSDAAGLSRGPVHRVPDDVLREIFLRCSPPSNAPVHPSKTEGPLQLSQVCSNWRAVAHDFSRLWSSLVVERPYFEPKSIDETTRWLRRSNNTPIDFHLILTSDRPFRIRLLQACLGREEGHNINLLGAMRVAIRADPERQRRLEAELKESASGTPFPAPPNALSKMLKPVGSSITRLVLRSAPISNLTHLPRRAFPHLQRLVLVLTDRLESWQFDWISYGPIKAFLDCPSLRYVALGRFFREPTWDFVQLPLQQLTHLLDCGPFYESLHHPCWAISRLLSAATRLRLLHVSFQDDSQTGLPAYLAGSNTILASVESLSIEAAGRRGTVEAFFSIFTFPSLQRLRYYGLTRELEGFLRSGGGAKLNHLSLTREWALNGELMELISERAPQLRSLEVTYNGLKTVSTILASNPSLLPNLQTILVRCENSMEDDPVFEGGAVAPAIHRFVRNRVGARDVGGERLQRFRIFDRVDRPGTADRLYSYLRRRCDEERVELEVTLERIAVPNDALDPLFLDPELADWDGLRELCVPGRGECVLDLGL